MPVEIYFINSSKDIMTHPVYSQAQLEVKTLTELKALYTAIGCTRQVADKRSKESWVTAILRYQEEQAVKISPKVRTINLGNDCFNMSLGMTSLYLHPTTDEIGALETTVELNTGGMNYEVLATCANPEEAKAWATAYLEGQNPEKPKTCSDCPQFDSERGCCKLFNMVAKPHWAMTNDCISEMEVVEECVNKDAKDNINIPAEHAPVAQQSFIDTNHETAVEAGFVFTQETRGESLFWCGRLNKYHTGYFPELSTAAKFAVKYLSSALHKRHQQEALNPPIDTSKYPSARDEAFDLDDEETAFVQSGDIAFKEVTSTTYNVFNKGLQVGVIALNQGHWAIGINNERYATPYLAAAALVEAQLKLDLLDKPVSELTKTEWTGLKQTVSAEVEGRIEELLEKCEVDGNPDSEFGTLYRLWHGMKLLGTFYRPVFSDKWLARPSSGNGVFDGDTEEDARYWIAYAHITGDYSGDKSVKLKLQVVAA